MWISINLPRGANNIILDGGIIALVDVTETSLVVTHNTHGLEYTVHVPVHV